MSKEKSVKHKPRLHARNRNRERYDLAALTKSNPRLLKFVKPNKYGEDSIDFANPDAVRVLNTALLNHYYGIKNWKFPKDNLCPPIPGRADYIHHIADLLCENNFGVVPTGDDITCLDIGVGASCIYPIIGVTEYAWNFIATDIDKKSLEFAEKIALSNPTLEGKVEFRYQSYRKDIFNGILAKEDEVDVSICNPPFHASMKDAQRETRRKVNNLAGKTLKTTVRNFSGISNELICEGGELWFIKYMIRESKKFSENCFWFTTLVSKQSNLKGIYKALEKVEPDEVKTIPLGTGNKSSRIVAWTYLSDSERKAWREARWSIRKDKV